jgi:two-component system NtrC family sensor kinase
MAVNLERLRDVEERLSRSERLAAIGTFAAGIAHEINNPIGNVIGIAKLLQKNTLDAETCEDIDTIVKNAERCARITRDLLAYSRQSPPKREMASLSGLIDDVVQSIRGLADQKGIVIRKDLPESPQGLFVDPLQMSQALNNILMNAVQSIETSGTVTLRSSVVDNGIIEIAISDTGCGMDAEVRDKIFYPFFTTKPVGEGTGLGLAISYGIIRNHGGDISLESEKGSGSTFRIRLPMGETSG